MVAINDELEDRDVNFVFDRDRIRSANFARYITSVEQDVERLDDVSATGSTLTVTLPTQTITTFVSDPLSVGNEAETEIPSGYALDANYPNPFNPSTIIAYAIPETGDVTLKVFDVHGREIETLIRGQVQAGRHQVRFDATGLPSGVYFYTLSAGDTTLRKSMLLVR
jgi:hypothetical protein